MRQYSSSQNKAQTNSVALFSTVWFLAVILSFALYIFSESCGAVLFTISSLSGVAFFIYLFEQWRRGRIRHNILGVFFVLLFFLVFVLRGLHLSFDINAVHRPLFVHFNELILAMCYALLGSGSFLLGFHSSSGPRSAARLGRFIFQRKFSTPGLYLFSLLGVGGCLIQALFYFSSVPAIAYLGAIPGYLSNLGLLSIGLLLVQSSKIKKFRVVFCLVCVSVYLLASFIMGQRSGLIHLLSYMGIYLILTRPLRVFLKDKRILLGIIVICGFFAVFYPTMSVYKGYTTQLSGLSGIARFRSSIEICRSLEGEAGPQGGKGGNILVALSNRTGTGLDFFALLIARTPEVWDFQYGKTILSILITPIPRALWLDKPEVSMAGKFYEEYYGYSRPAGKGAAGYSTVGDFYLNFHVAGIILGMFVFGLFCRAFQVFCLGFDLNKADAAGILFFALNALVLVSQAGTISDIIGGLLNKSLFIFSLLVLIGSRVRHA